MTKLRFRPRFEPLEERAVPAALYVSPSGSDANAGTSAAPWKTLQNAANRVAAGDTVFIRAGDYAGFDLRTDGTAAKPITFLADPGARVTTRNPVTTDGINLEGASWVVIQGFTVINQPRAGIRSVLNDHVTIQGNTCDSNGVWGIFAGFSNDLVIEGNTGSRSKSEHGIYVSNSSDRPVISGNTCWGNNKNGIHMNGDLSSGGDGIISSGLVENNVLYNNGVAGGSGINCDGVQNSTFKNNLIYNTHASGISLYQIDGGGSSTGNKVVNNTVLVSATGRWALNIQDGSTGTTVRNNVLYNYGSFRGSVDISADSLPGLVSDYNAVMDRFTRDGGGSVQTLAQWRSATGQDVHSLVATPTALFVNPSGGDYHLKSGSPAIDKGTSTGAPTVDFEGTTRPQGAGYDIGHDEYASAVPPPPPVGSLQFNTSSYTVSEGGGLATITVTRVGGSAGAVSVQYALAGGTATAGSDYTAASGTLNWADGETAPKSFTVTILDDAAVEANETVNLSLTSPTGGAGLGTPASVVLSITDNDVPPPPAGGQPFAVGSDAGLAATVTLFNPNGTARFTLQPFGSAYTGGVKVASGDVTGDGVVDVVVGSAGGLSGQARVIDGATGALRSGTVFSSTTYTGIVEVAVGDVTGDGVADVAVGTSEGGPWVRVYRGGDFVKLADFRPISGAGYQGRARVALGDVNKDGRADLTVSGLYADGTHVAVINGKNLRFGATLSRPIAGFTLTGAGFASGVNLATGDVNGDGYADLVFGSAFNGSRVLALSGRDLVQTGARTTLADFSPAGTGYANGTRVALRDVDGDGRADLLAASGTGSGNRVTVYRAGDLTPTGSPPMYMDFTVFANYTGGLSVG